MTRILIYRCDGCGAEASDTAAWTGEDGRSVSQRKHYCGACSSERAHRGPEEDRMNQLEEDR